MVVQAEKVKAEFTPNQHIHQDPISQHLHQYRIYTKAEFLKMYTITEINSVFELIIMTPYDLEIRLSCIFALSSQSTFVYILRNLAQRLVYIAADSYVLFYGRDGRTQCQNFKFNHTIEFVSDSFFALVSRMHTSTDFPTGVPSTKQNDKLSKDIW